MGQLVAWPKVVTEGADLEEWRFMLLDALNVVLLAYQQQGKAVTAKPGTPHCGLRP